MSNVLPRSTRLRLGLAFGLGLVALAQLALAVADPAPAAAFIPEGKCWSKDQWQEVDCTGPMQCFDAAGAIMPCDASCGIDTCFNSNGVAVVCPIGGFGACEVAHCYANGQPTDCVSGCGATECYDAGWGQLSCADENAAQACPPVHCLGAGGESLDCASECDIAQCFTASWSPIACPIEYAHCNRGPALCCVGDTCYDQEEDCGVGDDEPWTCAQQSCATSDDDPGDYGDEDDQDPNDEIPSDHETTTFASGNPGGGGAVAVVSASPPITGSSSCACSQNGGVATDCVFDLSFAEFTPRSAPALDRQADLKFDLDAGQGPVRSFYLNGWVGPEKVPVGMTVGVHKPFASVTVPCGGTRTVPVRIWSEEHDGIGNEERGEMHVDVPLVCNGSSTQGVTQTHRVKLKNKRGKTKHEVDVTVNAAPRNVCTSIGGAPSCNAPPSPPAACRYDVYAAELYHRQSPNSDKKGRFWGDFNPTNSTTWEHRFFFPHWGYPLVLERFPTPDVKRGESYDMRKDIPGPIASYEVPCGGSVTPQIPVWVRELDNPWGITFLGKDDEGSAMVAPTLTCPPTATSFYHRTEVPLYGYASAPRHVVDIVTQQKVSNLNYCAPEPQEGLVTPCRQVVEVVKVTKVSGTHGNYLLDFEIADQHKWMNPRVSSGDPEWVPADDVEHPDRANPVLASISVPCGEQIPAELAIRGREIDSFMVNWPSDEYGSANVPLQLACGQGERLETVRMEFKNKRGKTKDVMDLELRLRDDATVDPPACQCRQ